ncbi:MAG: chromosomal replication initiator protein DnaA [Deltaproteobacteria bacterium]|nr:chromosomal replication initiator protein DnaA [Deltaproteobacteria bacterium]
MAKIWEELKGLLREKLPDKSFSLWIDPLQVLREEDHAIELVCPNKFSLNWVSENYLKLIQDNLNRHGRENYRLALKVEAPSKKAPPPGILNAPKQLALINVPEHKKNGFRSLNRDFTFHRFVVGKCNEFAYSASKALAMNASMPYSSLFILAKTGLGKSHLSQATAHAILQSNPALRVYYITAEDFVNEMIFALKSNRIEEFKNKYRRSCDVLLLEEVHFLSGKEKTQLELGYTLDALADERKRIIFTSSLLPKDIPNLTGELSSRLTSGIITTLEKPDYETRAKILQSKSSEQAMVLSGEVIDLLAKELTGDIRQMESALSCLKAKSELLNARIDKDLAEEVLQCHLPSQRSITMDDIKSLVCRYFNVDPIILASKSRKKIHAFPRNIFVYLCRQLTAMTVEQIGRSLNRNHSTILYASEVIDHKIKVDKKVKNQVDFLMKKLMEGKQ